MYTHNATYPAQTAVRMQLVIESYDTLKRVREVISGVRSSQVWAIGYVGNYPKGIGRPQLCALSKLSYGCVRARLDRCINAGFVRCVNNLYYLTDRGQLVYDTIHSETFDQSKQAVQIAMEHAHKIVSRKFAHSE